MLEKDKVVSADGAACAAGVRLGMKRGGVLTVSAETEMHERDIARKQAERVSSRDAEEEPRWFLHGLFG